MSTVPPSSQAFPYLLPAEKPDRELSAALQRNYDRYPAPRPEHNSLYSQFRYTRLEGFDYHGHDATITRRDPSKVIWAKGKYYVWYTYRHTPTPPQGPEHCTDTIPARDWDLCELWYATSEDGFTWQEQGVAVPRPPHPAPGWRSVSTPDILVWKGRYYLYYQAFQIHPSTRGDDCPVAVSSDHGDHGPANTGHGGSVRVRSERSRSDLHLTHRSTSHHPRRGERTSRIG